MASGLASSAMARRSGRNRAGRRALDPLLRSLIAEMASANRLWGAPRIHGELQKLGIEISERTVSRLLAQLSRPPSQTWRTFLANHLSAIASMDFFTVSTLTGRVLFVLVVLSHDRRRVVHVNCTEHPTSAWTAQQLVEAFPENTAPQWIVRDRDTIFDDTVRRRIASLGISDLVSRPLSPWQNPYVERRTHLALGKDAPDGRRASSSAGTIVVSPEVGGLHHRYDRQAA